VSNWCLLFCAPLVEWSDANLALAPVDMYAFGCASDLFCLPLHAEAEGTEGVSCLPQHTGSCDCGDCNLAC